MSLAQETRIQDTPFPEQPAWLSFPAKIITVICHPVFMPLVMSAWLIFGFRTDYAEFTPSGKLRLLAAVGLNTIFFPLFTTFLLRKLGFMESYHMRTARERIVPLLASMIFYFWAWNTFRNLEGIQPSLRNFMFGNFIGIVALFLLNIFIKVSLHAGAAGAMIGLVFMVMLQNATDLSPMLFAAIIIAGLMGTSRMILKAHYPLEIWLGYITGILTMVIAFLI